MGKPLFETHRFGDRRTVVRRYLKGTQVMIRGDRTALDADRATVFHADCDVKVTEEFRNHVTRGEWVVVMIHTEPGDIVDANAPRETLPVAELRVSWWRRLVAWFWT